MRVKRIMTSATCALLMSVVPPTVQSQQPGGHQPGPGTWALDITDKDATPDKQ